MDMEKKKVELADIIKRMSISMKATEKDSGKTISLICKRIMEATDENGFNEFVMLLSLAVNFGQHSKPATVEAFNASMEKILKT